MAISANQTNAVIFPINRVYVITCIVVVSGALGFIAYAGTAPLIGDIEGRRADYHARDLINCVATAVFCALSFFALFWKVSCDRNTVFNSHGVSQPSVTGLKTIAWSDVTQVRTFNGAGVHLVSARCKIVISPYSYRKPKDVVAFLADMTAAKSREE